MSKHHSHLAPILVMALAFAPIARAQQTPDAPPPATTPQRGGADPSPDAMRMGSPPSLPAGVDRETMWPAPTAEDWARPCLIHWERTLDDAMSVARRDGKPLLVAVNMDGEIASEHFAGIRYRTPETAALYEPYVCVIASVYRHTPRDYDAEGHRIPCPRFGTVTCGEHIALEPLVYERFFEGRRIAPRHIMVELDGTESYDVYYAWDTQTIFTALTEGVRGREPGTPLALGDRPPVEHVSSPGARDRTAVERAYVAGDREQRRRLIQAAMTVKDVDQVDLLRLAIFGFDVDLARLARHALTECNSEAAVDLIAETLKLPLDTSEREALLAAAARLGETYPRARTIAAVHRGLTANSDHVDVAGWSSAIADAGSAAREAYAATAAQLEGRAAASEERPQDAAAALDFAESLLARAEDPALDRRFLQAVLEDAQHAARRAAELGAAGWRLDAVLAVCADALGDRREALHRAAAAVEGGMPAPGTAESPLSEGDAVTVLALFAQARQAAIARAYRNREDWPPEWLSDIQAAYAVLAAHPLGTDEQVASHYDFLRWIGATPRAARVLEEGLQRFAESGPLHQRLRDRLLWEQGADGLEAAYRGMLERSAEPGPGLTWFAAYASLIAAEDRRRNGDNDGAVASYGRAIARFEDAIAGRPEYADGADHYIALALAGRARIALEAGELASATDDLLAAFARRPASAATADGLNLSPVDTAKMLRARLDETGLAEPLGRLQAALRSLADLDPELLELPAWERGPVEPPGAPAEGAADSSR